MSNIDNLINSVLIEWSANCSDGLPVLDESGVESLYNSLVVNGLNKDDACEVTNLIAEKGKYPERQAYNKNGLLVTFPTPEYKARAIAKGTHFEKNPKVAQSNLFGGGQEAPQQPQPNAMPTTPQQGGGTDVGNDSELPKSDVSGSPVQGNEQPKTSNVPPTSNPPSTGGGGVTSTPAQGQLSTEPIQQPTVAPNVSPPPQPKPVPLVQKTPSEIAAEKEVIKQILNTNDTVPTVSGVGGVGIAEQQIRKLMKVAIEMELNEAVKILSKLL
jgi:hypothetical protein